MTDDKIDICKPSLPPLFVDLGGERMGALIAELRSGTVGVSPVSGIVQAALYYLPLKNLTRMSEVSCGN